MKMLKNFFAAFIALFAIGLTIAAQAGVFNSKFVADPVAGNCYRVAELNNSPLPQSSSSEDLCVNEVDAATIVNVEATCDGGDFFCCFLIETSTNPSCPLTPPVTGQRYQVHIEEKSTPGI